MNKFLQYLDRHSPTLIYVFIAMMFLGSIFGAAQCSQAHAHNQTPAASTFSTGQTLTAQSLNDTVAHLHNTLTGGILNENISPLASIDTTKLAAVDFIPKGYARITSTCTGSTTAGTACTMNVNKGSFLATGGWGIKTSGQLGRYQVHTSSPRFGGNPIVLVTSNTAGIWCNAVDFANSVNPQFYVECKASGNTYADALFTVVMW